MNLSVAPVIRSEKKAKEKVLEEVDKQIDDVFIDVIVSFVVQAFIVTKQDAFVDTKLTRMILEE